MKKGARGGFVGHKKKARNNMTIPDIMTANTELLMTQVLYHAMVVGACFVATPNRALSGIKIKVMKDDDVIEEWNNTPEELQDFLYNTNEALVATGRELGLLQAPPSS